MLFIAWGATAFVRRVPFAPEPKTQRYIEVWIGAESRMEDIMSIPKLLGYGAWRSPITSDFIVTESIGLSQLDVKNGCTFWVESRPSEGGRHVVVRRGEDGTITEVNPLPFNARTRVHEYGGGAYLTGDDTVFFTNFDDQMLYAGAPAGSGPIRITSIQNLRFANGVYDMARSRVISVCEDHRMQDQEPRNLLVGIEIQSGRVTPLVEGADFYASPTISPDGRSLAWISWNHPNMPWNCTELWTGEIRSDGSIGHQKMVAGGGRESILQPRWSPDGILYFVSDRSGWWNINRHAGADVEPVCETDAEFGRPQWTLGVSTYDFADAETIICSYARNGFWKLAKLNVRTGQLKQIDQPYSAISDLRATQARAVIIGGAPSLPTAVYEIDLASGKQNVLRQSTQSIPDAKYVSSPEAIEFETTGGQVAHAFFYPPKNDDFEPIGNELPPLIVKVHGGPTAAASSALNMHTQFWTSRGYAVVDVNYGGSSGYGRSYLDRLNLNWGVVDLDDCVNAAHHLARTGRIDGSRMAISGGSAGGYTALCAMTFRQVFQAATSQYGVSDLEALAHDTHKFESHYFLWLVGPYPEAKTTYENRSPLHFANLIQSPVLFLQGEDDKVVPPSQTSSMADAMLAKEKPFGLIMFSGEQHGFRRAETIRKALDTELVFFSVLLARSGLRC